MPNPQQPTDPVIASILQNSQQDSTFNNMLPYAGIPAILAMLAAQKKGGDLTDAISGKKITSPRVLASPRVPMDPTTYNPKTGEIYPVGGGQKQIIPPEARPSGSRPIIQPVFQEPVDDSAIHKLESEFKKAEAHNSLIDGETKRISGEIDYLEKHVSDLKYVSEKASDEKKKIIQKLVDRDTKEIARLEGELSDLPKKFSTKELGEKLSKSRSELIKGSAVVYETPLGDIVDIDVPLSNEDKIRHAAKAKPSGGLTFKEAIAKDPMLGVTPHELKWHERLPSYRLRTGEGNVITQGTVADDYGLADTRVTTPEASMKYKIHAGEIASGAPQIDMLNLDNEILDIVDELTEGEQKEAKKAIAKWRGIAEHVDFHAQSEVGNLIMTLPDEIAENRELKKAFEFLTDEEMGLGKFNRMIERGYSEELVGEMIRAHRNKVGSSFGETITTGVTESGTLSGKAEGQTIQDVTKGTEVLSTGSGREVRLRTEKLNQVAYRKAYEDAMAETFEDFAERMKVEEAAGLKPPESEKRMRPVIEFNKDLENVKFGPEEKLRVLMRGAEDMLGEDATRFAMQPQQVHPDAVEQIKKLQQEAVNEKAAAKAGVKSVVANSEAQTRQKINTQTNAGVQSPLAGRVPKPKVPDDTPAKDPVAATIEKGTNMNPVERDYQRVISGDMSPEEFEGNFGKSPSNNGYSADDIREFNRKHNFPYKNKTEAGSIISKHVREKVPVSDLKSTAPYASPGEAMDTASVLGDVDADQAKLDDEVVRLERELEIDERPTKQGTLFSDSSVVHGPEDSGLSSKVDNTPAELQISELQGRTSEVPLSLSLQEDPDSALYEEDVPDSKPTLESESKPVSQGGSPGERLDTASVVGEVDDAGATEAAPEEPPKKKSRRFSAIGDQPLIKELKEKLKSGKITPEEYVTRMNNIREHLRDKYDWHYTVTEGVDVTDPSDPLFGTQVERKAHHPIKSFDEEFDRLIKERVDSSVLASVSEEVHKPAKPAKPSIKKRVKDAAWSAATGSFIDNIPGLQGDGKLKGFGRGTLKAGYHLNNPYLMLLEAGKLAFQNPFDKEAALSLNIQEIRSNPMILADVAESLNEQGKINFHQRDIHELRESIHHYSVAARSGSSTAIKDAKDRFNEAFTHIFKNDDYQWDELVSFYSAKPASEENIAERFGSWMGEGWTGAAGDFLDKYTLGILNPANVPIIHESFGTGPGTGDIIHNRVKEYEIPSARQDKINNGEMSAIEAVPLYDDSVWIALTPEFLNSPEGASYLKAYRSIHEDHKVGNTIWLNIASENEIIAISLPTSSPTIAERMRVESEVGGVGDYETVDMYVSPRLNTWNPQTGTGYSERPDTGDASITKGSEGDIAVWVGDGPSNPEDFHQRGDYVDLKDVPDQILTQEYTTPERDLEKIRSYEEDRKNEEFIRSLKTGPDFEELARQRQRMAERVSPSGIPTYEVPSQLTMFSAQPDPGVLLESPEQVLPSPFDDPSLPMTGLPGFNLTGIPGQAMPSVPPVLDPPETPWTWEEQIKDLMSPFTLFGSGLGGN